MKHVVTTVVVVLCASVAFAQTSTPLDNQLVSGLRQGDCEAVAGLLKKVPALYGMSPADWTRANDWWTQKLKTQEVEKSGYDRLSQKYQQQFAARSPSQSAPPLRDGALEANREPMPLEEWVEIQQAQAAGQEWTLKRQGLTLAPWIRATMFWGEKFNTAMLRMGTATPAERAKAQKMSAERLRLSQMYKKKYAQGVPW